MPRKAAEAFFFIYHILLYMNPYYDQRDTVFTNKSSPLSEEGHEQCTQTE